MKNNLPLIIYDEDCPLCLRFKQAIQSIDLSKPINFVSLNTDSLYLDFPELNKNDCTNKVHMILEDRTILVGPQVVEHLLLLNPIVSKFSWLIESDSGKKALDLF